MRRKSLWVAFALILAVGAVVGVILQTRQWTRRIEITTDVATVEADIRKHLPIGSSRADVESYLDLHGISHSYVDEPNGAPEFSRTEMAMIRGASRTWLVRGDIQISFRFDNHGQLISHSVKEIMTGP
jgi:hypothetical protein